MNSEGQRIRTLPLIVILGVFTAFEAMAIDLYLPGFRDIGRSLGANPGTMQASAASLVALLKIVPETLKYSDRAKAGLRAPCSTKWASPSRRDTSWPFRFFALIDRAHIPVHTHTREKSWTACPPPPLVISS